MNNHKNLDTSKLNYVIYCRRSSEEGEDRQVQSLETQLRELTEHAQKNKLNVVEVISESKSAFTVGREGFDRAIELIKNRKANALLVVRANRISRNAIDAGRIISLMDEKKLLYIRTANSACYTSSSSEKMMLALELIFSKKDSDDKGDMVREGQKTKALKGFPHGVAALGFLNDRSEEKGNRKWTVDNGRLNKIKTLFDMFLTGTYSVGKLHKHAVGPLKLTTVKRKRSGGEPIVISRMYEILKDPIYAGFFYYGDERYELEKSLPRLITEAQHEKIKAIISGKNIPKTQHHTTTYSGFITSDTGDCVGQDVKFQLICDCKHKFAFKRRTMCPRCGVAIEQMENPKHLFYTWHYNVRKKKAGLPYTSLNEDKVTLSLVELFSNKLTFSPDIVEWSKKHIHEMKDKEVSDKVFLSQIQKEHASEFEEKKRRTRVMLRDKQITQEEYDADIATLQREYPDTKEKKVGTDWYSRMMEITDISSRIVNVLNSNNVQAKRNILAALGSNLVWNDKELLIINRPEIDVLINGVTKIRSEYPKFEPRNHVMDKGLNEKTSEFSPVFSTMLHR